MIPYRMNPLGISGVKSILGYAPNAEAFWDGLNNVALGTFDTSATSWKDLTGNGYDLIKGGSNDPLWGSAGGLTGDGAFRGLYTANSPLESNFTVELVFVKPNTDNVWWWNNRNPWYSSATRGIQCISYNTRNIYIDLIRGTSTVFETFAATPTDPGKGVCSLVYDGASLKAFYNGTLYTFMSVVIDNEYIVSSPFHINGARDPGLFSMQYAFYIYAVRVYRRALTAAELTKNYQLDASRFNL